MQREILNDRYAVVLVDGAQVASVVRKYMLENGLSIEALLDDLSNQYEDRIGFRDPDSVLT